MSTYNRHPSYITPHWQCPRNKIVCRLLRCQMLRISLLPSQADRPSKPTDWAAVSRGLGSNAIRIWVKQICRCIINSVLFLPTKFVNVSYQVSVFKMYTITKYVNEIYQQYFEHLQRWQICFMLSIVPMPVFLLQPVSLLLSLSSL